MVEIVGGISSDDCMITHNARLTLGRFGYGEAVWSKAPSQTHTPPVAATTSALRRLLRRARRDKGRFPTAASRVVYPTR
jgi:hypothetical protein